MIDRIYIINLEHERTRKELCCTHLLEAGVPPEKISVWKASDNTFFPKTRDLCEAAAADGFLFFQKVLEENMQNEAGIGYLALLWSNLRILRHICETNETAIVIEDDTKIECQFDDLVNACEMLPKDLLYAQLTWADILGEQFKWLPKTPWSYGILKDITDTFLYSPRGALYLLEKFVEIIPPIRLGRYGACLRDLSNEKQPHNIFTLVINPIPRNLEMVQKFQTGNEFMCQFNKTLIDNQSGWMYAATTGIPGITESSLHEVNSGATLKRLIDETKDAL